jgi:hypothetical protein
VTDDETTNRIIEQGHALVRAVEALEAIEPSGWFERAIVWLLLATYGRRLEVVFTSMPERAVAKILDASKDFEGDKYIVRISNN